MQQFDFNLMRIRLLRRLTYQEIILYYHFHGIDEYPRDYGQKENSFFKTDYILIKLKLVRKLCIFEEVPEHFQCSLCNLFEQLMAHTSGKTASLQSSRDSSNGRNECL